MNTFDARSIDRILVLVDFSPWSDAALDYALKVADGCGAEVEVLHVWCPRRDGEARATAIFAETRDGIAMERLLSTAECQHVARVCGRLEFGDEASRVIVDILERERFDLVVMGLAGRGRGAREDWDHRARADSGDHAGGHVTARVITTSACRVVTMPPSPLTGGTTAAA